MPVSSAFTFDPRLVLALAPGEPHAVLRVTGADRLSFLHSYTTHEIQKLGPGTGCTTAISNWRGTITDFVRVLVRSDDVLLVGTAERARVVKQALDRFVIMVDVHLADISADWRWIELAGPATAELSVGLDDLALDAHRPISLPALTTKQQAAVSDPASAGPAGGHKSLEPAEAIAVRTWSATGQGLGLVVPSADDGAWRSWLAQQGAVECSPDQWDYLRIAAGIPRFGLDMGEDTNVWEARLDHSVSMDKGCYLGQEIVARLYNYRKVQRYLMGVRPLAAGAPMPHPGTDVSVEGKGVGKLTSAARGPDGSWLGLAIVGREAAQAGQEAQLGDQPVRLEDRPYWSDDRQPTP